MAIDNNKKHAQRNIIKNASKEVNKASKPRKPRASHIEATSKKIVDNLNKPKRTSTAKTTTDLVKAMVKEKEKQDTLRLKKALKAKQEKVKEQIRALNKELSKVYYLVDPESDYGTDIRHDLSNIPGLNISEKTGKLSTKYDTKLSDKEIELALQSAKETIGDADKLRKEAKEALKPILEKREKLYGKSEKMTADLIKKQVQAHHVIEDIDPKEFKNIYDVFQGRADDAIIDAGLESWLEDALQEGRKHVWSDIEFAEVYYNLLEASIELGR